MNNKRNSKKGKPYKKPSMRSRKIAFILSAQGTQEIETTGFGPYRDAPRR